MQTYDQPVLPSIIPPASTVLVTSGRGILKNSFFLFLMIWPVFWSFANIIPTDPLYVNIPDAVRFLEPISVGFFLLVTLVLSLSYMSVMTMKIGVGTLLITVVGLISGLISPLSMPSPIDLVYGIYTVILTFVVLFSVIVLRYSNVDLQIYRRYLLALCVVNWLMGVYQTLKFGIHNADFVHGFFEDANVLAEVFYFLITYYLFHYISTRKRASLRWALFLFPIAYFGFNERLNLFFLCFIVPALLFTIRKQITRFMVLIPFVVLVIGSVIMVANSQGLSSRVGNVIAVIEDRGGIFELGFFKSYVTAWQTISDSPATIIFGVGPSNFAGSVASSRYRRGTATPVSNKIFDYWLNVVNNRKMGTGAYDSPANFYSNMLGEFGLVGFFALLGILYTILRQLWRIGKNCATPAIGAWAWASFWTWLGLIFQALFVPYGVFGNLMAVTPVVFVTGVLICLPHPTLPIPPKRRLHAMQRVKNFAKRFAPLYYL